MALLCVSGRLAGAQARSRVGRPRASAGDRSQSCRSRARGLVRFPSAGLAGTASAEGDRPRRVDRFPSDASSDYEATLRATIERVVISRTTIEIELAEGMASDDQNCILIIPWTPPSSHRRREIIQGEGDSPSATRPTTTSARGPHGRASRCSLLARRTDHDSQPKHRIARRARRQNRTLDPPTISLAFLCPALVKAAIDGRLPRGFGVKRLMELPMAWPDQWSALGLGARLPPPDCHPNGSRSR